MRYSKRSFSLICHPVSQIPCMGIVLVIAQFIYCISFTKHMLVFFIHTVAFLLAAA